MRKSSLHEKLVLKGSVFSAIAAIGIDLAAFFATLGMSIVQEHISERDIKYIFTVQVTIGFLRLKPATGVRS